MMSKKIVELEAPDMETVSRLPIIYSNTMQMITTPWDFQIRFGQVVPTEEGLSANWLVQVMQSPQHAKAFYHLLAQQIEAYEENYGEIPDLRSSVTVKERTGGGEADSEAKTSSTGPAPPSGRSRSAPRG